MVCQLPMQVLAFCTYGPRGFDHVKCPRDDCLAMPKNFTPSARALRTTSAPSAVET